MKNELIQKNIFRLAAFAVIAFPLLSYQAQASQITAESVINLANEAREKDGLPVLQSSSDLDEIAQEKADDMIRNGYFAHTSPAGLTPWYWFGKNGYDYRYAGENLAINFQDAESEQAAWMKSPTHRKNILNADYREIGAAVVSGTIDGQPAIIAVQEFGTRIGSRKAIDKEESAGKDKELERDRNDRIAPAVLSTKNDGGSSDGSNVPPADDSNASLSELFGEMAKYLLLAFAVAIPIAAAYEYRTILLKRMKRIFESGRKAGTGATGQHGKQAA